MSGFLPLLVALAGCSDPPQLQVEVTDVWSKPLAGATVRIEGVQQPYTTGADGKVSIEVEPGTLHVMAGQDAYIKDLATVEVAAEAESIDPVQLTLFPEPDKPGFYGVDTKGPYKHLEGMPIEAVATEMSTYHGIKDAPDTFFGSGNTPLRFVFNTTLRPQEIKRQDLHLSKLEYLDEAEVKGVLGETQVPLHLWVAANDVEYEVKGMQSKDDYLIVIEDALEPGMYAFHAQAILDAREAEALDKLPKLLQVAFAFEIK